MGSSSSLPAKSVCPDAEASRSKALERQKKPNPLDGDNSGNVVANQSKHASLSPVVAAAAKERAAVARRPFNTVTACYLTASASTLLPFYTSLKSCFSLPYTRYFAAGTAI